jgi:hypothetical protein
MGFSNYNSANMHEKRTGLDMLSAFPGIVQRHVIDPLWYKDDIKRKELVQYCIACKVYAVEPAVHVPVGVTQFSRAYTCVNSESTSKISATVSVVIFWEWYHRLVAKLFLWYVYPYSLDVIYDCLMLKNSEDIYTKLGPTQSMFSHRT